MTAYKKEDLYSKLVTEEASDAFRDKLISEDSYKKILEKYTSRLYTPNYFIRIGMGILASVSINCASLLFTLTGIFSGDTAYVIFCFFMSLICYGALEFLVNKKYYFNAGIDNILAVAVIIFLFSGFVIQDSSNQFLYANLLSSIACGWLAYRFTDSFMASCCYLFLFGFIFLLYTKAGSFGTSTLPFVMMLFSVLIYFFCVRIRAKQLMTFYRSCADAVLLLTLITFYASGNYFVVKEVGSSMLQLKPGADIPFAILFWVFTFAIPLLYVFYGIRKRSLVFVRTGMILLVVSILTVIYYNESVSAEAAIIIGGVISIAASAFLIRYLKMSKGGFTSENTSYVSKELKHLETMILAQIKGNKAAHTTNFQFGGGSSGGGGATGGY